MHKIRFIFLPRFCGFAEIVFHLLTAGKNALYNPIIICGKGAVYREGIRRLALF